MFIFKNISIVIFVFMSHSLYSQVDYPLVTNVQSKMEIEGSPPIEVFYKTRNKYAYLLNKLPQDKDLPTFILNKQEFGNIEIDLWFVLGTHDCSTFREALFKRVTNKHTLRKIIANPATSLDYIAVRRFQNASFTLPYSRYSLRQLAKMRLKELQE